MSIVYNNTNVILAICSPSNIVGRAKEMTCFTLWGDDEENFKDWMHIDFGQDNRQIAVSAYTLQHSWRTKSHADALVNWVLEGSRDGVTWTEIDIVNDCSLLGRREFGAYTRVFGDSKAKDFFSFLRVSFYFVFEFPPDGTSNIFILHFIRHFVVIVLMSEETFQILFSVIPSSLDVRRLQMIKYENSYTNSLLMFRHEILLLLGD